jgi:N6-adenosine-specific RNA methylase IME4
MEKIAGYEIHPAAAHLPIMSDGELEVLAKDVRERGLIHPVVLFEGKVIDGRNRLKACELAGVQPSTIEWVKTGDESVVKFVVASNLLRRHLNESQRGMLAADLLEMYRAEAHTAKTAHLKRGTEIPESAPGRTRAAEKAAADVGAATRTVERAKFVAEKSPELAEKVRKGEATLKQAEKELRRAEQKQAVKAYQPPVGEWAVIVADPPWPYEDTLDGSDQARGGLPYPPMTMDEICAMKIPASRDCALWLWVTNSHLIDGSAARVLREWDFEPKALLTWKKDRMGAGRYLRNITEHVILAVRGKPMIEGESQINFLEAKRREHSRKPDEFFDLVERVCPSLSRLEMFSREPRRAWTTSGAEAELFAEEKRSSEDQKILEGPPPIDRGDLCGLRDGKKGDACFHKLGHEGVHSNGYRTWPNKAPKRKPPVEIPTKCPGGKCEACGKTGDDTAIYGVIGNYRAPAGGFAYGVYLCPADVTAAGIRKALKNRTNEARTSNDSTPADNAELLERTKKRKAKR